MLKIFAARINNVPASAFHAAIVYSAIRDMMMG
jgi:hypothetical protein